MADMKAITSVCTITAFQRTHLATQLQRLLIDHVIAKVGGATLESGDLNNMVIK